MTRTRSQTRRPYRIRIVTPPLPPPDPSRTGDGFDHHLLVLQAHAAVTSFARPGPIAAAAALTHWRRFEELTEPQRRAVLARIPDPQPIPVLDSPAHFLVETVRMLRRNGIHVSEADLDPRAFAAAVDLLDTLTPPGRHR